MTGFGIRVQPSGVRSYIVNYRAGGGGRKAANRRLVVGRHGWMTPEQARRAAHETLGKVAAGEDPAGECARTRAMPTLRKVYADYFTRKRQEIRSVLVRHGWCVTARPMPAGRREGRNTSSGFTLSVSAGLARQSRCTM